MHPTKDAEKFQRLKNYLLKSSDSILEEEIMKKIEVFFMQCVPQNYTKIIEKLRYETEIWEELKEIVRKFEGLEQTRINDVESDETDSKAGLLFETVDIEAPNPVKHQPGLMSTRGLLGQTKPTKAAPTDEEKDILSRFADARLNNHEFERSSTILNHHTIFSNFGNKLGLSNENSSEFFKDLEMGTLLYMKTIMGKIIQISEESKKYDAKVVLSNHKDQKSHLNLALVNDLVDKFKNAEKRELKIQDFYDSKIKNNREKEENHAKEKNQVNLQEVPTEKPKSKGFNEVNLSGPRNFEYFS